MFSDDEDEVKLDTVVMDSDNIFTFKNYKDNINNSIKKTVDDKNEAVDVKKEHDDCLFSDDED